MEYFIYAALFILAAIILLRPPSGRPRTPKWETSKQHGDVQAPEGNLHFTQVPFERLEKIRRIYALHGYEVYAQPWPNGNFHVVVIGAARHAHLLDSAAGGERK